MSQAPATLDYASVAPPPLPVGPPPTPTVDRLGHVDFLRGVALLLILVMNIQSFAMPFAAMSDPWSFGFSSTADQVVWQAGHVLVYTKAMAMFTILFGAGIVLQSDRVSASNRSAAALFYRRVGVLAAIGLLHGLFLWYGDILFMYAVVGSLAFLLRKLPAAWLLVIGATTPLLFVGLMAMLGAVAFGVPSVGEGMLAEFAPSAAAVQGEIEAHRGSYADALGFRVAQFAYMAAMIPMFGIPVNGGLMLIGMALWKLRFFAADAPTSRVGLVGAATLTVGGLIMAGEQYGLHSAGPENRVLFLNTFGLALITLASPFLAVGYLAIGTLVYRALPTILALPLRCTGQTALSGYLLTTLICTTIYYGHGFGYFMYYSRSEQFLVVLGVWAFLLVFSVLWLRAFRFGPFEWIWRSATYGTWQPLRRSSVSA